VRSALASGLYALSLRHHVPLFISLPGDEIPFLKKWLETWGE
jgi:hypothetical protein